MPVFPQFAQRLAQLNNPMQRQPDDQQQPSFDNQMPMPSNINNPMSAGQDQQQQMSQLMPRMQRQERSSAVPSGNWAITPPSQMKTDGLPAPSGTGGDAVGYAKPARTMVDKVRENVAKEIRYEDIAPKMEVVPGMPPFQPKPGGGVWNHIKGAAQGFAGAGALSGNNPLAAIAGGIAGGIKPEMGQNMAYRGFTVPQAQAQQKQVMGRNADRQTQFHAQMQDRIAVQKMNEANRPEYGAVPGAEYPTLFEKHSGEQSPVLGPDGKPQRAASVTNTEANVKSREQLAFEHEMMTRELAVAKNEAAQLKQIMDWKEKQAAADKAAGLKKEIVGIQEAGRNRRMGVTEGGKDRRSKVLSDKSDREERRRKTSASPDYKTKDGEFGPSMDDVQTDYQKKNGLGLPSTSGTGSKSNRRQLPPPSGTSPN